MVAEVKNKMLGLPENFCFKVRIEISSATAFMPVPGIYLVAAVQAPATPRSYNLRAKKDEKIMTYICSK